MIKRLIFPVIGARPGGPEWRSGMKTKERLHRARAALMAACAIVIWTGAVTPVAAAEAVVAVAANFKEAMERLEIDFERSTDHRLTTTFGSTGKLYAQITNGAPFDIFLAADQARPLRLAQSAAGVAGSRFTYAIGKLTLWSPDPDRIGADAPAMLRAGEFRRLAIANPDLAPYGAAAMQVIEALDLETALQTRLVMAENVGQAFAYVASGNAELGFTALSYVISIKNKTPGSRWEPPQELYSPIRQDAILLERAVGNEAARAFMKYLASPEARAVIARFGYGFDE